jgi:ribose-phosphate pyrophosphokinase
MTIARRTGKNARMMTTTVPLIFAPQASAVFAQDVAALLGTSLAASEEREFEGGEHKMRPTQEVRGQEVYVFQSLHGDSSASANDKLCRVLFFIGALKDAGAARVTACLPYLAYARKDRRTQARDPVTTRYVAQLFEAVGADRVVALDVHNEAAFDNAFRLQTVRLDATRVFARELALSGTASLVVASPDAGGMKRAHQFRAVLEEHCGGKVGTAFMEKARSAGVVSGENFVGDVNGAEVIIYDDLIASGTTVLRTVQAARKAGAVKVHVAATHAVFTAPALQLFAVGGPDSVLVSDSIPLPAEFQPMLQTRLKVCSVAGLFAELVRCLHNRLFLDEVSRTG